MSWCKRGISEGHCYHVFARGVGRSLIFEDDTDRQYFLHLLAKHCPGEASILAWCLMDNHFHLLLQCSLQDVSSYMQKVLSLYARRYNLRHDHVGHVFQGRFGSQAVSDDEYLLTVARYIHRNPLEAQTFRSCEDYAWSSYREYLGNPKLVDTGLLLEKAGGLAAFTRFHKQVDFQLIAADSQLHAVELNPEDDALFLKAEEVLGEDWRVELWSANKKQRDQMLVALKESGLSVRQIERLTGVGRNIIARAKRQDCERAGMVKKVTKEQNETN